MAKTPSRAVRKSLSSANDKRLHMNRNSALGLLEFRSEFIQRLLRDLGKLPITRGRATNYRAFRDRIGAVGRLGCSRNLDRAAARADFYDGAGGGLSDAAPRADCGLDG
jgi:hypothetical protein